MKCGLIGEKLGHSFSKRIHAMLAGYDYELYSLPPEELDAFVSRRDYRGLNVTIPYKKAVIPLCDELSETARQIGSVNTLVRTPSGRLIGDNTDLYGFLAMTRQAGITLHNAKVLILGFGGTSLTAQAAAAYEGARGIVVVSRGGPVTYAKLGEHKDADIIVNTTPVGMYPQNGEAPVDLSDFPHCGGVLDVVYNPLRTALVLDALRCGIPCGSGLYMLVAQAKRAAELFLGQDIADSRIDGIHAALVRELTNIVVIGMPGCGKTSIGVALAKRLCREHIDMDDEILRMAGQSPADIIVQRGEAAFRAIESEACRQLGKRTGLVISTGGGVVTREENLAPLRQNGMLVFIERALDALETHGRPLSGGKDAVLALYEARLPLYLRFADASIRNDKGIEDAAKEIAEVFHEAFGH
jgi:shikimate dehydrogenase